jgi:DNA-binding transcriptional ArsR family regulator
MTAYAIDTPFSPIPESVEQAPTISNGAKIAYGRLLRYAQKTGKAWPKVSTLAEAIGASVRQTYRYLAELKDAGLIEARRRGLGRSNVYRFPTAPGKVEGPDPDVDAPEVDGSSGTATNGSSIPYSEETKSKKTPQAVSFDSDSEPPPPSTATEPMPAPAPDPSPSPKPIPISAKQPAADSGPLAALESEIKAIEAKAKQSPKRFTPRQFSAVALREKRHPEAIHEALRAILKAWDYAADLWGYGNRILAVKSGNFHERDHQRAGEAMRAEIEAAVDPAIKRLAGNVGRLA